MCGISAPNASVGKSKLSTAAPATLDRLARYSHDPRNRANVAQSTSAADVNLTSGFVLKVNGTQVISSRQTGYSPTWTSVTANRSATLTNTFLRQEPTQFSEAAHLESLYALAEFVKGMYDDLVQHGVIGA